MKKTIYRNERGEYILREYLGKGLVRETILFKDETFRMSDYLKNKK